MSNFSKIQEKLQGFIRKYYTNEIIKGTLLFLAFGLLYFLITLLIEYFLWLKPLYRSVLFWLFIGVELLLLIRFLALPVAKLIGLKNGLTPEDASKIIGTHFNEVNDKLLNILQLSESNEKSELLLAGIEQKSLELQPVPFKRAIDFKTNRKYIKYLAIPLFIWLATFITGDESLLSQSFTRVVHYNEAFSPPAPFRFLIDKSKLHSIQGAPFELKVQVNGRVLPEMMRIRFNGQEHFMKRESPTLFSYRFESLLNPLEFTVKANSVQSDRYMIDVFPVPVVQNFEMQLDFPSYTLQKDKKINGTGNATVPEGTRIKWILKTTATDSIKFMDRIHNKITYFDKKNHFELLKTVKNDLPYQISTSNTYLTDYEKMNFAIRVIKDAYPEINVRSDIDSVNLGPVHFEGMVSDDYGIGKLVMIIREEGTNNQKNISVPVNHSSVERFFVNFPDSLKLKPGTSYKIYFQVFDNDRINGSKSARSKEFSYHQKTKMQQNDALMNSQQKEIEKMSETFKTQQHLNRDLEKFNQKLKRTENLKWDDRKELQQFLKRQRDYQQMMQKNQEDLLQNLQKLDTEDSPLLKDKKEALQKRLEELKEIQKNDKLLKELSEMAKKLQKEGMIEKLKRLNEKNKQQSRSLERMLEMLKQFYVEQKMGQTARKLDSLAAKQQDLQKSEKPVPEKQKKLQEEFKNIQKEMQDLRKENESLKNKVQIPDTKADELQVKDELKKAAQSMENDEQSSGKNSSKTKKHQKSAANALKQMSNKLKKSLAASEAEMIDENIDNIKRLLHNLLNFSFEQENLMNEIEHIDAGDVEFPKILKKQQNLKVYFQHIDDSLYTLSLRLVKLTTKIQTDLANAHYYLDRSLDQMSENQIRQAASSQHFTMTSANNLADLLSNILESLQNPKMSSGKGKGKNGMSLPDIIQKQKQLGEKMKKGMQQKQKGKSEMDGELYEIYKEQERLKQQLRDALNKSGTSQAQKQKIQNDFEALERMLLEKGFDQRVLQRMKLLEHELLKLDNAKLKQGTEQKRKSTTATDKNGSKNIKKIPQTIEYNTQDEQLIRKSLPLSPYYQKKLLEYFKKEQP